MKKGLAEPVFILDRSGSQEYFVSTVKKRLKEPEFLKIIAAHQKTDD